MNIYGMCAGISNDVSCTQKKSFDKTTYKLFGSCACITQKFKREGDKYIYFANKFTLNLENKFSLEC